VTPRQPVPDLPSPEEYEHLREELYDLRQTLEAIRGGDVDAVVVGGPQGEQLYRQISADRPYRVIVEEMGDGAVTVSARGVILFANDRMAKLVGRDRGELLGVDVTELVDAAAAPVLDDLLAALPGTTRQADLDLRGADGARVPVLASVTGLEMEGAVVRCLIVADLTDQRRAAAAVSEARQQLLRKKLELEEEHRLKETMQRAVLPARLPEGTDFHLAARYLPADLPSIVGGDWYDAFRLPDGALALAVGDVVGHDLDAAATMGQMRNALRAYAFPAGPPASVLARLNGLTAGLADGGLATAVFGLFDTARRTFRWASAGQPPPMVIGTDGPRLLSPPVGTMLGADPGFRFDDVVEPLQPGDLLVLYSDGLIERRNSDLDADFAALLVAADDLAGRTAEQVSAALVARLVPRGGHEDDVCLLVLEVPGAGTVPGADD